ncbi:MAG: hypothetical protein H6738_22815 [Alphaproteobacteria bacterium]|nr:hypothetical protein [Alphaproteobacteria bacterium]MCB9699635.1 hypothetical protein [Alphaproteobacteria bacterium]
MRDSELAVALEKLGIGPDTLSAVLLLPLVQVAWADGSVQAAERLRILEVARGYGLTAGPWEHWLAERPSDEDLELGRRVLVALALRHRGPTADWGPRVLQDVEQHCLDVARAAGGLFGVAFSTSDGERRALAEIGRALKAARADVDEDLPDPDSGSFDDL